MTSLDYDRQQDACTLELMHLLSGADINRLIDSLKTMGYSGWIRHYFQKSNDIQIWFYASAGQKTALLKTLSDENRVLLVFGAIWHSQFASVCRFAFDDPDIQNQKDSYARRASRGLVVATGLQALMGRTVGWPFDVDCPFPGWN